MPRLKPTCYPILELQMTLHTILKMGDPRLLRTAQPVTAFDTDELHLLISDMLDTMRSVNGAGLAMATTTPMTMM